MQGIKFISELADSGYGRAGRGYMRELRKLGIPITWTPMVPGRSWGLWQEPYTGRALGGEFADLVNRPMEYDTVVVCMIPQYFRPWREREAGKRMVGMTVWELDILPPQWVSEINQVDVVVVPCRWNRDVFHAEGVRVPVGVVPLLGPEKHTDEPLALAGVGPDDFVFYTVSIWNERKSPFLTLASYLSAFRARDRTVLVIKTGAVDERRRRPGRLWNRVLRHYYTVAREVARMRAASGSDARVVLVTERYSDAQMAALHARGDCYVALTRTEGWGLGAYEAGFAGNPVIMTGYGGQLDFLPAELSHHVRYRMVPCSDNNVPEPFAAGANPQWPEADVAHGAELMREMSGNPGRAKAEGAALQRYLEREFDSRRIVDRLVSILRDGPGGQ